MDRLLSYLEQGVIVHAGFAVIRENSGDLLGQFFDHRPEVWNDLFSSKGERQLIQRASRRDMPPVDGHWYLS